MRIATLALAASVLLISTAAAAPQYRYRIDESASQVTAKVAFFGLASKTAQFPKMHGGITLSPQDLARIDLLVELDATQLTAGDGVTLARLKSDKFFDVARYPAVTFAGQRMTMTGPETANVAGSVTARGVTRPATLAVTFTAPPARATGHEAIDLTGTTTIDRRQFGMTSWGLIVGNQVTIRIKARMVPA